ncbi:hypothetical protein [Dyadobacter sp. CY347]|uniref:hypothetical protein n=1 Tax=Dyadobacter sp. CY347 TaxID=2909336 RepID=UPI001F2A7728|nr:hypothetical protein [Dyadobacter sp. CY347]MCF2491503.1 hypothetical protein [Dyadobacter sp. CY347]
MEFTFYGIELGAPNNEISTIWHPSNDHKSVIIQLEEDCRFNYKKSIYSIARQTIHCLHPADNPNKTSVLAEGVAEWYAQQIAVQYQYMPSSLSESRQEAYSLVSKLIRHDPGFVKKLRSYSSCLSKISVKAFKEMGIYFDQQDISKLISQFVY